MQLALEISGQLIRQFFISGLGVRAKKSQGIVADDFNGQFRRLNPLAFVQLGRVRRSEFKMSDVAEIYPGVFDLNEFHNFNG